MSFEGDQLVEPAGACDTILPGSSPSRKNGGDCNRVSHNLVMKTLTTSESPSNYTTVTFTSAVQVSNNQTHLSNTSASALMCASLSFMLSSSMSPVSTSSAQF